MNSFSIGISALTAGRRGLDLTGQNITNASTRGYSRQTLNLSNRAPVGGGMGLGVEVAGFVRFEAPPLRTAILAGNSEEAASAVRLDSRRQIEAAFGQGENTVGGKLEQLFNKLERLSTRPGDTAIRREVVTAAGDMARQFNTAAENIDQLRNNLSRQASQAVDDVNALTSRIADLNGRIYAIEVRGETANDFRDQRDRLIDDLSKKIDLRTVNMAHGVVNVIGRDTAVVVGETATQFELGTDPNGLLEVTVAGETQPQRFDGGTLGGLLREHNVEIPGTRGRLDTLAAEVARRVDKVQATGLGLDGPVTTAAGSRPVTDPTQPLASQNLPIPITNGTLTISVTNTGTQARTASGIAIDPTTMSLNDVAAAITAGTGGQVTATVQTPENVLQLQAASGFAFDFAGRPDSPPADPFAAPTVADTDSAGVLAGLGVNTLFQGSDATSLAVRPEFQSDPNRLAASVTGRPGDSTNLDRFAAVRTASTLGGRTLTEEYTDLAAEVGTQVRSLDDQQTAQAGLLRDLNAQEQGVVGVDVNEELVKLMDYQRMVEGASRFIAVVNDALQSMIDMTR